MKFKIFKFKNVTSTNDVAIDLIKEEKTQAGCVYADTQTKGRGTYGKQWISIKGNLFASIFFHVKKNYPPFNEFSIINPVIISEIIKKICKNKVVSIKWPNDVFVNKKKICGILQELITIKNKNYLIIGIGINVTSNPKVKTKYKTTNILSETQNKIKIKKIVNIITSTYEKFFAQINLYNYKNIKKKAETLALIY